MKVVDFILNLPTAAEDATEADTRAQIIDPILSLLGWSDNEIKREPFAGWSDSRGFIDYLLQASGRSVMVIEAKKSGRSFGIPQVLTSQRQTTYRKLHATGSPDLREALDQCLRYAQHTGALYACATNGFDWVIFKPTHPSRPLPDAKVIIFNGRDQILKRIDQFVSLLSPRGVQEGKVEKELLGRELQVPAFSKRLQDAFPYRENLDIEEEEYSGVLDGMLRHYVIELTTDEDFEECYLPARGNKTSAESIEDVILGKISSFKDGATGSAESFTDSLLTTPSVPGAPSGRTVVLHGEVGVGKTSFLRYCEHKLRSGGRLGGAVWAKVDLLPFEGRAFDLSERNLMLQTICKSIQSQVALATEAMSGNYDPEEWKHLRDIYNSEVRRLQKGRFPSSDDSDPVFLAAARDHVWSLVEGDAQEHLVRVIKWLTVNCRLPVVIALDNSDQLGVEFQEFLFKLTETLKAQTSAVVILVLRTEALASHVIREHSIASVRDQFLVHKAPLASVLKRRFEKIIRSLPSVYPGTVNKVARDRMTVLMETIEYEAQLGSDSFQLIEAAGNGSLRDNLRAISGIFKSSPKSMDRLVVEQAEKGRSRLGVTRVIRALMRADLSSSDAQKLIPNVFNVDGQLTMPYSLGLRILQQIRARSHLAPYSVEMLLNDFSMAGVDRTLSHRTLSRMRYDRFVSVPHMLPELRSEDVLTVTRLGGVLLEVVIFDMSYFCRVAFATYIYDRQIYNDMRSAWTSDVEDLSKKFTALGRLFIGLIESDDSFMRGTIDLSVLEPVVAAALPGLLASPGVLAESAEPAD